jgi:anti-sigma regulatory factor (Ser/Thr protein kinase)
MPPGDRSEGDGDVSHALERACPDTARQGRQAGSATTLVNPLRREGIPADAAHLVGVRKALEQWAVAAGLPDATAMDVVLASYEAMANAAEHAYRNRRGTIDLLATCDEDEIMVIVRDRGEWRPPPADPGHRGRGLIVIRSMSQAEVQPGPNGTTVRMRWSRDR